MLSSCSFTLANRRALFGLADASESRGEERAYSSARGCTWSYSTENANAASERVDNSV